MVKTTASADIAEFSIGLLHPPDIKVPLRITGFVEIF
jgi:hypothetical protein